MTPVYQFLAQLLAVLTVALMGFGLLGMPLILLLTKKPIPAKHSYNAALIGWSKWEDSQAYLSYIVENHRTWNRFHRWFAAGSAAMMLLPMFFLTELPDHLPLAMPASLLGAFGGLFSLLATTIDMCFTPKLAAIIAKSTQDQDDPAVVSAWQTWYSIELWRELPLKSLTQLFFGIWLLWLGSVIALTRGSLQAIDIVLAVSSLGGGLILIFLGVTQALKLKIDLSATDNQASLRRWTLPFGERGWAGQLLMALIILVWGTSAALWLWP